MTYRIKHGGVTIEADSLDEVAALTERLGSPATPPKSPGGFKLAPDDKSWESWHTCGNSDHKRDAVPESPPPKPLQLAPEKDEGSYYKKGPVTVGKRAASCGVRRGQFWKSKKNGVIAEITGIFDSTQDGKIYEKVQVRYVSGDTHRRNWSMRVTSLVAKYLCCEARKLPPKPKPLQVQPQKKTPVKKAVVPAQAHVMTSAPIFDPKRSGKGYSTVAVVWLEGPKNGMVKISNLDGRNPRWVKQSTLKNKYNPRTGLPNKR